MSNQLPDDWEYKSLSELSSLITKGATPSSYGFQYVSKPEQGGVKFIRGNNATISGKFNSKDIKYICNDAHQYLKRSQLKNGDVIISIVGSIGTSLFVDDNVIPANINQNVALIRPNQIIDNRFLLQVITSPIIQKLVALEATTQAQPSLSLKQIGDFVSPVPPLPEQQKIAAILTSVDDVIEKTQAQINKLKDLKTGMMQELLTCGVGVDGKPHTEFKDSPVGRIPKGWDVVTLKNITNRITDGTHQSVKTSDDGVHPFLYVSCIKKGQIQWEKASYLSHDEYEKASKGRKPIIGDILYSAVGSYGNAAVVTKKLEFSFQRHIAYIQPNNTIIDSFFLAEYLNSQIGKKQADFYAIGNAQLSVTLGDLGKFQILLPPLIEQRKIVSLINSIDLKICCAEEKNAKNKAIKKALMQDLLTGKVRVNVD
ncbi:restriction endonuclease subunit S [Photobacterium leiognathi]|uniref:restriction endonuclease subunit S n=1 Tax=Photobacterium leiognathi TaxID=553611 RepID=UPI002739BE7C|nr:restriction endonuclease subunit S [Photobacterium leiognathi]